MELRQFSVKVPRTGREVQVFQKGSGPDLVFLHGAGGIQMWTSDLEMLSARFRVTAPVHPGWGKSTGGDQLHDVLDLVLHTYDALGALGIEKPHLVGHSMGGMLAAEMAATAPNDVASITLVTPIGLWDDAHPVLDFFTLLPNEIAPYIFHDINHPVAQALSVTPSADEVLVEMYVDYAKSLAAAGRFLWPIPDRGLSRRIDRIKVPTLVLWGESDRLVPVFYAKEFGKRIAGSRVKIIKEASHMVLIEKPAEATAAIMEFVAKAAPAAPKIQMTAAPAAKKPAPKTAAKAPKSKTKPKAKSKPKLKPKKPMVTKSTRPKPAEKKRAASKPKPKPRRR